MAPPKKKIDVSPTDVSFDLNGSSTCVLTLTNSSDENVAYKIKTTTPKRYLVKPNQEILMGGASISVTVVLQPKEANSLLEQPAGETKDKFLVATVVVDDTFVNQVSAARSSPKEVQALFASLWEKKDKDDFKNLRLGCKFTSGSKPLGGAGSASPAPKQSSASALPVIAKLQAPPPSSERKTAPLPATPAPGVSFIAQSPEAATTVAASPTPSSVGEDASTSQQKYKEIFNLLVQITDERDRYKASYAETIKENMALKEKVASKSVPATGGGPSDKVPTVAALQLWHLVLVAIVAFLLGRAVATAL